MSDLDKLHVACELLNQSLRLYYEGDSYFASLHLAGAAEEVLGGYVEEVGGTSSYASLKAATVKLSGFKSKGDVKAIANLMNRAKNNTKHRSGPIFFDAESEAKELLDRAVTNYCFLMSHFSLEETALIRQFNEELVNA